MKNILFLLTIGLFSSNGIAQNVSKDIADKNKFDYFYLRERFVRKNKTVLSIYNLTKKDELRLDLLDEDLDEIKSIIIPKSKNANRFEFKVEGNFIYIINDFNKPRKNPGIEINRIALDGDYETKNYLLAETSTIIPDISNEFCFYKKKESGELVKFNFETSEKITIDLSNGSNQDVSFSEIISFENTPGRIISKLINSKEFELDKYSIALYDDQDEENASFNRLENNNYKAEVFYANIEGQIITSGNFVKDPTIDDVFSGRSAKAATKRKEFDGIYIRSLNAETPIEKYYDYSAFPNLFEALNSDKREAKLIDRLTYVMEDIIKVNGEYVAIGTINEMEYARTSDTGPLGTEFKGTSLKYILIYGFNDKGEITWDKIISPDWDFTRGKYDRTFDLAEAGELITINKIDNTITCHFSLIDKIHYFEISNKNITNYTKTEYEFATGSNRLKDEDAKDLDQYEESFYWYDNFYCSYLEGFIENETRYNRTEFGN